jgi:tRNA (cytidine/uridine-2'-O-)-methyltransferase
LKRAGLDYWKEVDVELWDSFEHLEKAGESASRFFFLTTKTDRPYYDVHFRAGDFLVFGRETKGLPESLLRTHSDELLTIPMRGTRSLNLATAVGIVLFEGVRQQSAARS